MSSSIRHRFTLDRGLRGIVFLGLPPPSIFTRCCTSPTPSSIALTRAISPPPSLFIFLFFVALALPLLFALAATLLEALRFFRGGRAGAFGTLRTLSLLIAFSACSMCFCRTDLPCRLVRTRLLGCNSIGKENHWLLYFSQSHWVQSTIMEAFGRKIICLN